MAKMRARIMSARLCTMRDRSRHSGNAQDSFSARCHEAGWHDFSLHGPDKEPSRQLVIARLPQQTGYFARKADHGRAEAVLIALYGLDLLERERAPARAASAWGSRMRRREFIAVAPG
jgi:hypothetical protein